MIAQIGDEMRRGQLVREILFLRFRPLRIDELEEIEADADAIDADQFRDVLDMIDVAIERALVPVWTDEDRIDADDSAALADHPDLFVADVALDVVKFSRIRVRNDRRFGRDREDLLEAGGIDVSKIDNHA